LGKDIMKDYLNLGTIMKTKIKNIKALIRLKINPANPKLNIVLTELEEVLSSYKVSPMKKANILKVMHLLRSLESTLKLFLQENGIPFSGHSSMGKFFHIYNKHNYTTIGNIDSAQLNRYVNNLSDYRNQFMHNAGEYPTNESVINNLLNEIEICLIRILNL